MPWRESLNCSRGADRKPNVEICPVCPPCRATFVLHFLSSSDGQGFPYRLTAQKYESRMCDSEAVIYLYLLKIRQNTASELRKLPPFYPSVSCRAAWRLQGASKYLGKPSVLQWQAQKDHTHLVSCMFPYENLAVGVPEAHTPIGGGADADVTLSRVLTERKAWHQVFVAHELTWKTHRECGCQLLFSPSNLGWCQIWIRQTKPRGCANVSAIFFFITIF